ncbi:MAG: molybdopterin dinucleotide binding domain-containing protein [Myxococcota bacterium]
MTTSDKKIHLELPDMLEVLQTLRDPDTQADDAFPFVLSAGERRSFTANTIIRDPSWRKKDSDGALRMSPGDASTLGVETGDRVRLATKRDRVVVSVEVSESMQPGHLSLPNGLGLLYPDDDGNSRAPGVAPNELTASEDCDPFVGTPWHKYVPAAVERIATQ